MAFDTFSNSRKWRLELCYNLRYVHSHGRSGEYPWSFRQTAVYQANGGCSHQSRWVFLHPPSAVESNLANIFADSQSANMADYTKEPLFSHLLLLVSTEGSWRDFLAHLESEIEALVSRSPYLDSLFHVNTIDITQRTIKLYSRVLADPRNSITKLPFRRRRKCSSPANGCTRREQFSTRRS
jgi:hypothetical protein